MKTLITFFTAILLFSCSDDLIVQEETTVDFLFQETHTYQKNYGYKILFGAWVNNPRKGRIVFETEAGKEYVAVSPISEGSGKNFFSEGYYYYDNDKATLKTAYFEPSGTYEESKLPEQITGMYRNHSGETNQGSVFMDHEVIRIHTELFSQEFPVASPLVNAQANSCYIEITINDGRVLRISNYIDTGSNIIVLTIQTGNEVENLGVFDKL